MITEMLLLLAAATPGAAPGPGPAPAAAVSGAAEGQRQSSLARLLLRQQEGRLLEHRAVANRQDTVVRTGLRIVALLPSRPALARLVPAINTQIRSLQGRLNVLQVALGRGQAAAQQVLAGLRKLNPPPRQAAELARLEVLLRPRVAVAQGRPPATPVRVPSGR